MNQFAFPASLDAESALDFLLRLREFGLEQLVGDSSDGLLARIAVQGFRAAIPVRDSILGASHQDRVVAQIQQPRLFLQSFFDLSSFRDVADVLRRADDAAVRVLDRRNRQRNVQAAAVFRHAHGFVVLDPFSAAQPSQNVIFFRLALGGNQPTNRLSDDFLGGIPEHSFGGGVPTGNDAVQRFADDRIVGRRDDGG
jgi:hypothetical protein